MVEKQCSMCKATLPITEFSKKSNRRDGHQSHCKNCHKKYRDRHYDANRQKYVDKAKAWSQEFKKWWWEYKKQFKCVECGETHVACLTFHHPNDDKFREVSNLIKRGNKDLVIKEIQKCVCLCANCHMKLHFDEHQAGEAY